MCELAYLEAVQDCLGWLKGIPCHVRTWGSTNVGQDLEQEHLSMTAEAQGGQVTRSGRLLARDGLVKLCRALAKHSVVARLARWLRCG